MEIIYASDSPEPVTGIDSGMRVELVSYMQPNIDYLSQHNPWKVGLTISESEWIASAAMRSTRTDKPFHEIMNENPQVECPHCKIPEKGEVYRIDDCFLCENTKEVDTITKRMYDSLKMGHYTVAGMTDFIFLIEGVSRALSHQLVRHRTAWFLQQSQRTVNPIAKDFLIPESVMESGWKMAWDNHERETKELYEFLVEDGVPKEDARFLLPNATPTRLIMKIDGSNLLHFLKLRTNKHSQWEIRELAEQILKKVQKVCPTLFAEELSEFWW